MDKIDTKIVVQPAQQAVFEFELACPVQNLIYCSPAVFAFFVFSEMEQATVTGDPEADIGQFQELLVLPMNVLRFMPFVKQPNFGLLAELTYLSENSVLNTEIQLADLNKIFPNLGGSSFLISFIITIICHITKPNYLLCDF